MRHDSRIKCLDHLLVYHLGEKLSANKRFQSKNFFLTTNFQVFCELHVVFDESLTLKVSHGRRVCIPTKIVRNDCRFQISANRFSAK